MSDYLDPHNEELLKDFFAEAQLQVDTLEQNILVLENDPSNQDAIDEIFRAAHTLKGGAATVEMSELADFTHHVEDLLDEIRSGHVRATEDVVDTLLTSIDIIKAMLQSRLDGSIHQEDISATSRALAGFAVRSGAGGGKPSAVAETGAPKAAAPKAAGPATAGISEYEMLELRDAAGKNETLYRVTVSFNEDNPMNTVGGIQVFAVLKTIGTVLRTDPEFEKLYEDNFFPTVDYYLSSSADAENIEDRVCITDVTTGSRVLNLTDVENTPEPDHRPAPAAGSVGEGVRPEADEDEAPADGVGGIEEQGESGSVAGPEPSETDHPAAPKGRDSEPKRTGNVGSILRVESRRIDNLLNLVSETVINKATFNQISTQFAETLVELQNTESRYRETLKDLFDSMPEYLEGINAGRSIKEIRKEITERYGDLFTLFDPFEGNLKGTIAKFRSTAQNLGRITGELQEGVMRIRMVPISQIFSRFPRLVRDLTKSLGKQVRLVIEGEETELDKSVIEDLLDPLIHCVRNSIDHGIESPADRKKSGKKEEGTLLLRASNEGNMILIEISDDGRGIDVDAVRKRAVDRGLIHPSKTLTDIEAFSMIFEPGFSTARQITNVSGRGVGLDVVKKQIDKLNGNVRVWSERGIGTRLTIKLPLTLAIIQGLLVRVGREIYAIPITSVIESHRIRPSEIKMIDNYEVFNVRDDVISLLRLYRLFRIETTEQGEYHFVVIVGSGDKKMGLMVDALIGEEDVVIKPLKDQYTNSPGVAGATILGDGTVSLIIDVSQLLELGLRRELEERRKRETTI